MEGMEMNAANVTEKIKMSFKCVTVKIALAAVVLGALCPFMPWLTEGRYSMSMTQAFAEKPGYFTGMPAMLIGGLLWIAVFFLLNHPKLSLVGNAPLLIIWLVFLMTASDFGLNLGVGSYLFLIAVIVCIVTAFMTKKVKNGNPQQ